MSRLEALGVTKRFRLREVVKDLSVSIESGQVVGLLGPNGAGKTTAFYMIVGLVRCDRGSIRLNGRDITRFGALPSLASDGARGSASATCRKKRRCSAS